MASFTAARLDEIEEIQGAHCPFRPVRHRFGITTFGITAMTAHADGDRLVNEHAEDEPNSSEELYFVASGRASFELDGVTQDAPATTFVHVPAGVTRTAFAREAGTTVIAIGAGPPGKPFAASGWELFAPLHALYESGAYAEAADLAQELLASDPPHGVTYYNTACFESLAGRTEAALGHLRRAIGLSPELAELARGDADLSALRELEGFSEIAGA